MSNSFWSDFFANFLSDLLVGALLGTLLAWWIGKKLNALERSQQRKDETKAEIDKAIRYLNLLHAEIRDMVDKKLPELRSSFIEYKWGREIRIEAPFWDVVGRLLNPKLLRPDLLWSLTMFYSNLAYAKRARDLLIQSWLVPHPNSVPGMKLKQEAFFDMTVHGLDEAMGIGKELIKQVVSEIEALKKQLEKIE